MSHEDDLDELGGEENIILDDDIDSFDVFSGEEIEIYDESDNSPGTTPTLDESALGTPLSFSISPISGDLTNEFTFNVIGASPGNRVDFKVDIPWKTDPIITAITGSGTTTVRGETIAARAQLPSGQENKVTIYAQEIISLWPDKESNRETIYVITTKPEPPVTPPVIPPITPPTVPPVTPPIVTLPEAAAGIQAGKQYWIKCTLPLLDLLPGFPYFEGIPILPGFRISENM